MARKKSRKKPRQADHPVETMKMCKLTKEGLREEIDRRNTRPTAYCNRCGSKANAARDLCQPRVL